MEARNRMKQPRRWRSGVVASAVALLAGVACLPAHALSLGKISVLSALGEPLRAEIDVAQITPDEASSLKAAVATPEAFKAAGLEYTPVLAGLQVTLQRRADGRSYLRLTSSRPVSEPFVDLVLQATWSAGRLTRDYTMLFDPPGLRPNATAAAPTAPVLSRPTAPAASIAAPRMREPVARPSAPATSIRPEATAQAPAVRPAPAESVAGDKQLTVKPGDTAGKIAAQNKPGVVSLDQMLVAMLRSNPNAFIDGNINRLKAGAVLDMPGAAAAGAISASEASQTIVAQSKDFNAFRRKLAEGVATTQVGNADRQAGGKVQAKVEDRAPAVATPDKLTLSKGAVQAKAAAAAEDAIAKSRQASDASARVAELSKNISDLKKLGAAPGAAASPPGSTSVSSPSTSSTAAPAGAATSQAPGITVPTPSAISPSVKPPAAVPAPSPAATPALAASAAAPAPQVSAAAPAPSASSAANPAGAASTAMAPATTPAASDAVAATAATVVAIAPAASQPADSANAATAPAAVTVQKPVVPAAPPPETRLLDDLMENPLVLPLAAGLLALLAGLGIYSYRKKNASTQVDSSFLESRLQPDSFFGASGGQRIDTNEASPTGSSLVYSPSQLDAAGDVDPVAEADVYLAYGRDLQAEEILKEALRTNPARVAVHAKLAEIHAKRRDNKAFEAIALEAFNLTQGNGPEWAHITEMGRELEPSNPLYQPGGEPAGGHRVNTPAANSASAVAAPKLPVEPVSAAPVAASLAAYAASSAATLPPTPAQAATPAVDVDLDLDFPLGGMQDGQTSPAPIAALVTGEPDRAPVLDKLDMDFSDISSKPIALTYPVPISKAADAGRASAAQSNGGAAAPAAVLPDSGMLEFDLDSLSLDLNGPNSRSPAHDPTEEDPLHTKFLLAEEFRSLGDPDGARSLAEEVLAEAQGPLKVKAQAFLNALA